MTVFCRLVFGRVTRYDRLSKTILQGTLGGGRRRGRQKKCWMDNTKGWTSLPMPELLKRVSRIKDQNRISAESSFISPTPPPTTQSVAGINWTGSYFTDLLLCTDPASKVGESEREKQAIPHRRIALVSDAVQQIYRYTAPLFATEREREGEEIGTPTKDSFPQSPQRSKSAVLLALGALYRTLEYRYISGRGGGGDVLVFCRTHSSTKLNGREH